MYKIDSELTEGGKEDERGEGVGVGEGFTGKLNHPILLLKRGEV